MSTHADIMLATHDLTKRYGSTTAVDRISIEIRRGEIYGFLGPNGAGKTTAMRMMLGLVAPTAGRVDVLGHAPGSPAALRAIGSMIETPAFYPHMSGRDNLHYLARLSGAPRERVSVVLDQVGLGRRGADPFRSYSLGMKQRLGVAAALLKDPPLLILDEPTNGLDPAGMAEMRALISRLGDEGRTIVISSHLMAEVEQVAQRVGVIAGGRMIAESTIDELRGEDELVIGASPIEAASVVAAELVGVEHVMRDGNRLRVLDASTLDPAAVNAALVQAGIEVRELRRERRSLETVFLTLTRDEPQLAATV